MRMPTDILADIKRAAKRGRKSQADYVVGHPPRLIADKIVQETRNAKA
jgi:hypothetical protein